MGINNLPAALQSVIQQNFLERAFEEALRAKLGFRTIADKEPFGAGIGETITKTRTGLLPAITTPLAAAANTDLTSGMSDQNYSVEQYVLSIDQYGAPMYLNIVTAKVAIASLFLRNGVTLAEQAFRSVDTLAANALFDTYLGGNTRVKTTLGAPATTVAVDDIRGFQNTWNSEGQPVAISVSNPVNVVIGSNTYSLTGSTADGSNTSTTPGGISGTLTLASSVTVADGTADNAVVSAVAPYVIRPSDSTSDVMADTTVAISASNDNNKGKLTMQMILNGKATMAANGVQPVDETGMFHLYLDPLQAAGLFADSEFQLLFRGTEVKSKEMRQAVASDLLGVSLFETNLNPVQTGLSVGTVRRGMLVGQGALVEGEFTPTGYAQTEGVDDEKMITMVDGIAHITREPLDILKQVVTQSWAYIGGFAVPSDINTDTTTIPTANNSAFKRGIVLESL